MSFAELLPVLKKILTNPIVIGTAVVVVLYMNFCTFVANYRKKPPRPKKKRTPPPPVPAKKEPEQHTDEEHSEQHEGA